MSTRPPTRSTPVDTFADREDLARELRRLNITPLSNFMNLRSSDVSDAALDLELAAMGIDLGDACEGL